MKAPLNRGKIPEQGTSLQDQPLALCQPYPEGGHDRKLMHHLVCTMNREAKDSGEVTNIKEPLTSVRHFERAPSDSGSLEQLTLCAGPFTQRVIEMQKKMKALQSHDTMLSNTSSEKAPLHSTSNTDEETGRYIKDGLNDTLRSEIERIVEKEVRQQIRLMAAGWNDLTAQVQDMGCR